MRLTDDDTDRRNETAVPTILTRHGLNAEEVLDEVNFPLLELDAPAICADRLDYGIRDSLSFGFLNLADASAIQKDLTVSQKGCFAFKNVEWARKLCLAYIQSDNAAWSNERHSGLYQFAVSKKLRGVRSRQLMGILGGCDFGSVQVWPHAKIAIMGARRRGFLGVHGQLAKR